MTMTLHKMSPRADDTFWGYEPNRVAAICFAILYAVSGCLHCWQSFHHKSWKMTVCLPVGCFFATAGFVCRAIGASDTDNVGVFIASTVLILSGPVLFAGADYFILGRTLYYIPWLSPINPGRIVQIFVILDFVVQILIASGGAKVACADCSEEDKEPGLIEVKVSLILQVVLMVCYIAILTVWYARATSRRLLRSRTILVSVSLTTSAGLIMGRSIYRVIEYFDPEVALRELDFYVLDAGLMLANTVMFNILHPGLLLPKDGKIYLAKDGMTEVQGPGWSDQRPWFWVLMDPFGFTECWSNRGKTKQFWDETDTRGFYNNQLGSSEENLHPVARHPRT